MAMGGKAGETFTEINVTPLTDVFLVLLVIMILVAPLVNQTVLKVDPPQAPSNQQQKQEPEKGPKLRVEVGASGVVTLNGTPINPPDSATIQQAIMAEQTKTQVQDLPLELQSEADAQQKYVVAVMDAAAGAGIKRMRVLPLKNNLPGI
ncbi:MAG: biopolymer transporter ExbD [Candidatus Obscuribacterales bacterium]|nr:biopolymer transporter ExbD [Candidatus Obscuribacterales bacterium]